MLYVYYGDDTTKLRTEALKRANTFLEGDGVVETLSLPNMSEDRFKDALGAMSLFRTREVWLLDTLSQDEGLFGSLKTLAPQLASSTNVFVMIEEKLGVKDEKHFKAYAEESLHFTRPAVRDFNIFALTDALSLRDKKTLWILLTEAWRAGKTSEEIIGTLLWQLKSIRLAAQATNATEAGMKPFVYEKAKRALKKFSNEEVTKRAHHLVVLYHKGHTGKGDIDRALERWVLTL